MDSMNMNYWLTGDGSDCTNTVAEYSSEIESLIDGGVGLYSTHPNLLPRTRIPYTYLSTIGKRHIYKPGHYDKIAAMAINARDPFWFADILQFSAEQPWRFASPLRGFLHLSAMLFTHRHVSATLNSQEEDINGDFCASLASTAYEVKSKICQLPPETGSNFFYTAKGRTEPVEGADFGIIAHLKDNAGDLYRPLLFQGKIASRGKRGRWSANIHRKDTNGVEQIDKIKLSGIGWYIFYHQDDVLPLPGPTVRSAEEIKRETNTSWTVDSFIVEDAYEPAMDFGTFLVFDVLDPKSTRHPGERNHRLAIERLAGVGLNCNKVLAVSTTGGAEFKALEADLIQMGWRQDMVIDDIASQQTPSTGPGAKRP